MKMKKILFLIFLIFVILCTPVFAVGDENAADFGQGEIYSDVPEEIREYIPSDFFDGGTETVKSRLSIGFFLKTAGKILAGTFPRAVRGFAVLIGILVISSAIGAIGESIASPSLKNVLSYISALCVCAAVYEATGGFFSVTKEFISALSSFVTKLMPVTAALLCSVGKAGSAAASCAVISAALAILEGVCSGFLFPLVRISFALSAGGAMCGNTGISGITGAVKKLVTYILSFVMVLLTITLSFQSIIAKGADTLALKGVKFAVGSFIPIVGSAINDAMTTVTGSIGMIRSAVGIAGAATVCIMTFSPLLYLLVSKVLTELSASFATMLGMEREGKFLYDVTGIVGFFISLCAVTGIFFIFALSVAAGIL